MIQFQTFLLLIKVKWLFFLRQIKILETMCYINVWSLQFIFLYENVLDLAVLSTVSILCFNSCTLSQNPVCQLHDFVHPSLEHKCPICFLFLTLPWNLFHWFISASHKVEVSQNATMDNCILLNSFNTEMSVWCTVYTIFNILCTSNRLLRCQPALYLCSLLKAHIHVYIRNTRFSTHLSFNCVNIWFASFS